MNLKFRFLFVFFILIMTCLKANNQSYLELSNEFIRIIVNNQTDNIGRFSIETTLGSPKNKNDDYQSLIYGRPLPWTSYTSIYSDNKIFIFGGKNSKFKKRSNEKLLFTTDNQQYITQNKIITEGFCDDLKITQTLNFFRHPHTRVLDTALISYTIKNTSKKSKQTGLRILLDTMLGKNDAAPFRFGQEAITSEREYFKNDLYSFWQTFDSLSSPNVIAQGTLLSEENSIFPPDRLLISNWGHLASNPWKNTYKKSRSFIQIGAQDPDTALALYWHPQTLAPGETRTFKTLYGIGGLNLSPGELSIGVSCPSLLNIQHSYPFLVMIYVMNTGGYTSTNTRLNIKLPNGITLSSGTLSYELGLIEPGQTRQIPVFLKLNPNIKSGTKTLKINISSDSLESNEASQFIKLLSPAPLKTKLSLDQPMVFDNQRTYTNLTLNVQNNSPFYYQNVSAFIDSMSNLLIPDFETVSKNISIAPYESATLNWSLEVNAVSNNIGSVKTIIKSPFDFQEVFTSQNIIQNFSSLETKPSTTNLTINNYMYLEIKFPQRFLSKNPSFSIQYDPDSLAYVRTSLPSVLSQFNIHDFIKQDKSKLHIDLNNAALQYDYLNFKIHFKSLKIGPSPIKIFNYDQQIDSIVINIKEMLL